MLDCKKPGCREQVEAAPAITDHLCSACHEHFEVVQKSLEQLGVQYTLNKFMVRGLDYYIRTTFEFITSDLGAQSAVCAGGRYDGLIEMLGGGKTPGIGFAMGLERLVLLLQQKNQLSVKNAEVDLFLAGLGETASDHCYTLMNKLRKEGLRVDMDMEARSLKSQMKQADKAGAAFVLILGDQELKQGTAVLRDMATKEQVDVAIDSTAIKEAVA